MKLTKAQINKLCKMSDEIGGPEGILTNGHFLVNLKNIENGDTFLRGAKYYMSETATLRNFDDMDMSKILRVADPINQEFVDANLKRVGEWTTLRHTQFIMEIGSEKGRVFTDGENTMLINEKYVCALNFYAVEVCTRIPNVKTPGFVFGENRKAGERSFEDLAFLIMPMVIDERTAKILAQVAV